MKGATALWAANIKKAPKSAIMTMIGRSQNFFLARRNLHSSLIMDNLSRFTNSKLVTHRLRGRLGWLFGYPVSFCVWVSFQTNWDFAERPSY